MKELLVKTHEAWIATIMASFMSQNAENKRTLSDFADILFRNFTWIEQALIDEGVDYDYDRDVVPIKVDRLGMIISNIIDRLNTLELMLANLDKEALKDRLSTDWDYIKYALSNLEDETISAFDGNRKFKNYDLTQEATDALTLFLFEESYKEYELIMIYNYLKAHSHDDYLNKIFQILIDESVFHLKSFCEMMVEMGILAVPRVIHKSLYQVEDVKQFLKDGIDEEIAAKEQCKELSDAVARHSEPLSKFFDFINYQESYHIELMKDALKHYESKEA